MKPQILLRSATLLAAGAVAASLVLAIHGLPATSLNLRPLVAAAMPASGVDHPVTAVLLNFRSYDTLLEMGVLLLAVIIVLAVQSRSAPPLPAMSDPVLQALARLIAPVAVLIGIYLLWAGAFRPGGAFQAGALLAAAAVLLNLTGVQRSWGSPGLKLRAGLSAGVLLFLTIAAGLLAGGTLLAYPPAAAGALILLIESGLTLSIACMLAGLFLFLSGDRGVPK